MIKNPQQPPPRNLAEPAPGLSTYDPPFQFTVSSRINLTLRASPLQGYLQQFGEDITCTSSSSPKNSRFRVECRKADSCLKMMLYEHQIGQQSFLLVPKTNSCPDSLFDLKLEAFDKKKRTLKVKQVPKDLSDSDLLELFGELGEIESHLRVLDPQGHLTTLAYIYFREEEALECYRFKGNGIVISSGYCLPVFILKTPRYLSSPQGRISQRVQSTPSQFSGSLLFSTEWDRLAVPYTQPLYSLHQETTGQQHTFSSGPII